MFDINFISQQKAVAGFEFMDYQSDEMLKEMTQIAADFIELQKEYEVRYDNQGNSHTREWYESLVVENDSAIEAMENVIFKYTGINVKIYIDGSVGNMAIDTAYFTPNHVLNSEGAEAYLAVKHTKIAEAFRSFKSDVIRGWVDPKTGKIGGDYSKIQFNLVISPVFFLYCAERFATRVTMNAKEVLAQVMCHEIGHAWGCIVMLHQAAVDSIFACKAAKMLANAEETTRKSAIYKEATAILEISEKVDDKTLANASEDELIIIFNKGIGNRNLRRTLSLGAATMTSEMYADIFAVRHGANKELVYMLADNPMSGIGWSMVGIAITTVLAIEAIALGSFIVSFVVGIFWMLSVLGFFGAHAETFVSGAYDTPYRRSKAMLRECISRLKNDKNLTGKDKAIYLRNLLKMEKAIEEVKPLLEGTFYSRFWGWMLAGTDFKARDFEFYTNELTEHTINLYTGIFKD